MENFKLISQFTEKTNAKVLSQIESNLTIQTPQGNEHDIFIQVINLKKERSIKITFGAAKRSKRRFSRTKSQTLVLHC
jgi:hypothetical protein